VTDRYGRVNDCFNRTEKEKPGQGPGDAPKRISDKVKRQDCPPYSAEGRIVNLAYFGEVTCIDRQSCAIANLALERRRTPKKYPSKTPGQQRACQTSSEVTGIVTV